MPRATVDVESTERHELKTCDGGFVVLRRMTYGQVVQRRALTKLSLLTQGRSRSVTGELAMASKEVTLFEYTHCIVDHNLEAADGRKLNLGVETDLDQLDPRIGQEIEGYIADMNNFEEADETQGN